MRRLVMWSAAGLVALAIAAVTVIATQWPSWYGDAAAERCASYARGAPYTLEWKPASLRPSWECSWFDQDRGSGGEIAIRWYSLIL
jgi:hypothetical protein